jgi:ferredoxin
MKPLGAKKTKTHVEGHQDCGTCHPNTRIGRQADKLSTRKQVEQDIADATEIQKEERQALLDMLGLGDEIEDV